ncbi:hypothetical protein FG078_04890 [Vibrio cholerae]|uniref:hypothetical protein n=1 Tax=Vibrio cholerae TaxID=666 RepID=UPI0011DC3800|nr:hypothetical protein [Vibrio cholerae]EGR0477624.1 hypothetical protein [Vibrio cholerae]EGR0508412.1 hypothetical protein [Vibrio cholerae]EGR1418179.1 hypothetical protein [Vibrio cholerae]EJL6629970.1 hypothetical protein [Vibrio cholerae]EJL6980166.1 hypothetical protein [Vibrio cholerae]
MEVKKIAGLLALVFVLSISISSGYSYVGDIVEKSSSTISSILTFLVVVGLIGVWRDLKIYKENEVKLICIFYPFITLITYIYPLYQYSEQVTPSNWYFLFGIDLSLSILVSSILWRNK